MVMFYDNKRRDLPSTHNRPLYVTASVKGIKFKRAMLALGSSLNIISLRVLDAVETPRERISRQLVEVSSFRDHSTYTMGFVNLT